MHTGLTACGPVRHPCTACTCVQVSLHLRMFQHGQTAHRTMDVSNVSTVRIHSQAFVRLQGQLPAGVPCLELSSQQQR